MSGPDVLDTLPMETSPLPPVEQPPLEEGSDAGKDGPQDAEIDRILRLPTMIMGQVDEDEQEACVKHVCMLVRAGAGEEAGGEDAFGRGGEDDGGRG